MTRPIAFLLLALWASLEVLSPPASAQTTEANDPTLIWRFPNLRSAYRDSIIIARSLRTEGLTTPTLELMAQTRAKTDAHLLGLSLATQDYLSTTSLSREEIKKIRISLSNLPNGTIPWGPHPLWDRFSVPKFGQPDTFPRHLLDNLKSDDISFNGQHAPEIYILGLQQDPERFLPPLLSRWKSINPEDVPQEADLLASLLLIYASCEKNAFARDRVSWYSYSSGSSSNPWTNYSQMDSRGQNIVIEAAEWSTPRYRIGYYDNDGINRVEKGNREMAWRFLERLNPPAIDVLRRIALDEKFERIERERALAIWMLRDVDSLLKPENSTAYIEVVTISHVYRIYPDDLFESLVSKQMDPTVRRQIVNQELKELFFSRDGEEISYEHQHLLARREKFIQIIRDGLERERDPYSQIILAKLLWTAEDPLSRDLILQIALANLEDDETYNNAVEGRELLRMVGFKSPEEVILALHAGLQVGIDLHDCQIVSRTAYLLEIFDEDFRSAYHPEVQEFIDSCPWTR